MVDAGSRPCFTRRRFSLPTSLIRAQRYEMALTILDTNSEVAADARRERHSKARGPVHDGSVRTMIPEKPGAG